MLLARFGTTDLGYGTTNLVCWFCIWWILIGGYGHGVRVIGFIMADVDVLMLVIILC